MPSVVLPEPDSPTMPSVSPRRSCSVASPHRVEACACRTSRARSRSHADVAAPRRRIGASRGDRLHRALRPAGEQLARVRMLRVARTPSAVAPLSTSWPRSITPTRCVKRRTRLRSWVMNSSAMPISRCSVVEQREDLRLDRDVERGRRLVGDQQLRLAGERHRDHRALALAARELVRKGVDAPLRLGDAGAREQLDRRARACAAAAALVQLEHLGDLVADRVERVQRGHRLLEDHRDLAAADAAHLRARVLGEQVARRRSGSRPRTSRRRPAAAPTAR